MLLFHVCVRDEMKNLLVFWAPPAALLEELDGVGASGPGERRCLQSQLPSGCFESTTGTFLSIAQAKQRLAHNAACHEVKVPFVHLFLFFLVHILKLSTDVVVVVLGGVLTLIRRLLSVFVLVGAAVLSSVTRWPSARGEPKKQIAKSENVNHNNITEHLSIVAFFSSFNQCAY